MREREEVIGEFSYQDVLKTEHDVNASREGLLLHYSHDVTDVVDRESLQLIANTKTVCMV